MPRYAVVKQGDHSMPPLQIFQDKKDPQAWRVEDNDADDDGACEVTIFAGYRAEERAREYAEWLSGRKGETVLDTAVSV
jgi:hypothetical protein